MVTFVCSNYHCAIVAPQAVQMWPPTCRSPQSRSVIDRSLSQSRQTFSVVVASVPLLLLAHPVPRHPPHQVMMWGASSLVLLLLLGCITLPAWSRQSGYCATQTSNLFRFFPEDVVALGVGTHRVSVRNSPQRKR